MNDIELLQKAAKAACYEVLADAVVINGGVHYFSINHGPRLHWNPLDDDGDALRLAVDLSFGIDPCADCGDITIRGEHHQVLAEVDFTKGESPMRHVRRAIVLAAAASLAPPQPTPYK